MEPTQETVDRLRRGLLFKQRKQADMRESLGAARTPEYIEYSLGEWRRRDDEITGYVAAMFVAFGRGIVRELDQFMKEEMSECHW